MRTKRTKKDLGKDKAPKVSKNQTLHDKEFEDVSGGVPATGTLLKKKTDFDFTISPVKPDEL